LDENELIINLKKGKTEPLRLIMVTVIRNGEEAVITKSRRQLEYDGKQCSNIAIRNANKSLSLRDNSISLRDKSLSLRDNFDRLRPKKSNAAV
jgi:hypothetical protein